MKKILFLLLLTATVYGQNPTPFNKIKITSNTTSSTATKVNVQEANGEINTIAKTDLTDILSYSTASALPVTGIVGKLYYTIDNFTYYTWNGTIYNEFGLGGGGASVSDTAYNATSWNGVTTIAPSKNAIRDKIESLPNGTVTSVDIGLDQIGDDISFSVSNQNIEPLIALSIPTASDTKRGALSSTDWLTFNNKQDALGFTPYNATNPAGYITTYSETDPLALKTANNLSDVASASTARTNLGLGSLATQSGTFSDKVDKVTGKGLIDDTEITRLAGVSNFDNSSNVTALSGKQPLATVLTNTTASFTTAQETKLLSVATGATANSSDATLLNRANHTGTQTASTISDFNTATDARVTIGVSGKQDVLVSGTNIKTINSTSLLGSGNIAVEPTITAGTTSQYWRGDKTWQTLPSGGDMVLASTQTNSGLKTFLDGTFGFRNVANTFTSLFTNINTAIRTYTFQNKSGTIAHTDDYAIVPLDEGNGIGYVINGRIAANYGNIGLGATDLSYSDAVSSVRGATASYTLATGFNTRASTIYAAAFNVGTVASGNGSFASGNNSVASGQDATSMGGFTTASGFRSMAVNSSTIASGAASFAGNENTQARSFVESCFGTFNTLYTPTSTTAYSALDRLYGIGNGTSSGARSDAFILLKNGLATLPSVTNSLIVAESTGKAVVTREYLESKSQTGQIIVTSGTSFTTPSTITTATVFNIELIGGGGAGGGGIASGSGSGGGAGGYVFKRLTGLSPSTTYTCAIGTGGTSAGTATTLTIGGTTYTANGGGIGNTSASSAGGAGGTGVNGDLNINGQAGDAIGIASNSGLSARGGSTAKGWGNGGAGVNTATNGNNATGYGGGGGAGRGTSTTGGNGSQGIIFCQWYN